MYFSIFKSLKHIPHKKPFEIIKLINKKNKMQKNEFLVDINGKSYWSKDGK
jgi:hypothetical protein